MDGNLACRERLDPTLEVTFPEVPTRRGKLLHNLAVLRRALRTIAPDMLVTSNWGTIEWAIANRTGLVPQLHVEDGFGPEERSRQIPRRVWFRRIFLAGRTVVVPSLTLRAIALGTWRLAPARVQYVPNGVDLARFGIGPKAVWPGDGTVVGTVAALRAEKNIGRLLRAFAVAAKGLPGRMVVVGDGPERASLQALATTLGIADRVHWAGHVPDPTSAIRSFDVFTMSSDTEQMPISLLEAMAAGLPVAASDVGDIAAMLPLESRSFVVPADPDALAIPLRRLLADATLRTTLGQANRARAVTAYDDQAMFSAWEGLWSGWATTSVDPAL